MAGLFLPTAVKKAIEVNSYTDPLQQIHPPPADKSFYIIGIRPAAFKRAREDFKYQIRENWIRVGFI